MSIEPITPAEIRSIEDFIAVRDSLRDRVIALKRHRRLFVGDSITLVFENRETLLWQIHEMVRVENITKPQGVAHECATYSQLLPGDGELSATLFLEIEHDANIRSQLDRLIGIDEATAMVIGDDVIPARFDPGQMAADRISAVHYIRFPLTPLQIDALAGSGADVRVRIEHPHYRAEARLETETRRMLAGDLAL